MTMQADKTDSGHDSVPRSRGRLPYPGQRGSAEDFLGEEGGGHGPEAAEKVHTEETACVHE